MPYIRFQEYPAVAGRQYRHSAIDPATGMYAAEVDAVLAGEVEIAVAEHARVLAAAEQYAAAASPAPPVLTPPSLSEKIDAILAALPADVKQRVDAALAVADVP